MLHKMKLRILGKSSGRVEQDPNRIREEILTRLQDGIVTEKGKKCFPYKRIDIRLYPPTKQSAEKLRADLIENSSVKADIAATMRYRNVEVPPDLRISLELDSAHIPSGTKRAHPSIFELNLSEPVKNTGPRIPELHLEISRGEALQRIYRLAKERLLIGCIPEVQDKEGRLVRKNNIVFPHEKSEVNTTVSNMHARIWYDPDMLEFRIMDESSRYGTRLVREGHTIEVPAENLRGIGLRSGDEVYFGQAGMRFVVIQNT
ncbi:MAG: FHA domain-containing protein [Acidobacteriota bacterium]